MEVRVLEAGLFHRDLTARVLDGLDHGAQEHNLDRALELVDADLGPHVGAVPLHECRVQPVLQQIEQLRALELLGIGQLSNRGHHITCIRHQSTNLR